MKFRVKVLSNKAEQLIFKDFLFPSHFKMVVVMWAFFAVMGVDQGLLFTEPLICNKCVTNDSLNCTMGHEIPANIGVGIRKKGRGETIVVCAFRGATRPLSLRLGRACTR